MARGVPAWAQASLARLWGCMCIQMGWEIELLVLELSGAPWERALSAVLVLASASLALATMSADPFAQR